MPLLGVQPVYSESLNNTDTHGEYKEYKEHMDLSSG